ncbi:MAG: tRNA pseudouridine(55) synthase TruB [Parcubacteria group bacterium SW_6_46_9]|nr:MAG: tRNA pseudouridine(55) synthase TruB [Parcubacteria group bacterium SW_6_46_9]
MLLLIDKPKGITSHDVVDRIRDITGKDKVGHGGTLDPHATGLLIVGVTREGTKQLGQFQRDAKKAYKAVIRTGAVTKTHDADGEIVRSTDPTGIKRKDIENVLEHFVGTQKQTPPAYSAVKVNGKRAYKRARNNHNIDVPPRVVTAHDIAITDYEFPEITIQVTVSSGTYIRSLARDIGEDLGCGGHLKRFASFAS